MKDKTTNLYIVIITGILSILVIFSVQLVWLKSSYDQQSMQFDQQVRIALNNVAQNLSEVTDVQLPNYDLITKKSNNYYLVNINETIEAGLLEFYLKSEFQKVQLQVPYEYGIYDCDHDRMIYGAFINPNDGSSNSSPQVKLMTSPDMIYYFGVLFPTRKQALISNIWIPISLCLLLVLCIIFFIYGLNALLHQRKLTRLQKSFIDNMAHELKTPLSTIKIASEVLSDESKENSRLSKYAHIVKNQNENLLTQVNRLLDIGVADTAHFKVQKESADLSKIVTSVVDELQAQYPEAEFQYLDQSNAQPKECDPFHMNKVMKNIIENAIKYSPEPAQISIIIKPDLISVRDQGIGIYPEDLSQIGKQFFRGNHGIPKDVEGFGLGLYYVKRICKLHGWKLEIESQVNQGTQVKIHLS